MSATTKARKIKKGTLAQLARYDEDELRAALEAKRRPKELDEASKRADALVKKFGGPVQTWRVTTEGDVEGRSIQELGTFTGHVVDIAMALKSRAYYTLTFSRVEAIDVIAESKKNVGEVAVTIADLPCSPETVSCWLGRARTGRVGGYAVSKGQHYNAVTIKTWHAG